MIQITNDRLRSSNVIFRHKNDGHIIQFLSCVHLGDNNYYRNMQNIIHQCRGIIFEERLTGDINILNSIPAKKQWPGKEFAYKLHKLMRMDSQRKILEYPTERTIYPDISYAEYARLYDFIVSRDDPDKADKAISALMLETKKSYIIIWFIVRKLLEEYAKIGEERKSYNDVWDNIWSEFYRLKNRLLSVNTESSKILCIYNVLINCFVFEPITSFFPERDTAVLRNIDLERTGMKRKILIVYGDSHYRGITDGLYDRQYKKVKEKWLDVCRPPTYSFDEFNEALNTAANSLV